MTIKLYHNPRCSKSRNALDYLEKNSISFELIEYLKTPLSKDSIILLCKKLDVEPKSLIRKKESILNELNMNYETLTTNEAVALMAEHPSLIERPIVETEFKAAIGRPLENIIELLKDTKTSA